MTGDWAKLVEEINSKKDSVIIAVDTPSGLDADSGQALGGVSVKATITVTFGAMKKGMINEGAAYYTGKVDVAEEIGLLPCPFKL